MSGSVLAGLALDATLTGGSQQTQIVDGVGDNVDSLQCTGLRGLAVAQAGTYFVQHTGNTTTAQLAAGATFTGTVEFFANQQAISVIGVCDQPLTITVIQYLNAAGTQICNSQTFTVAANAGFGRVIAGSGNFFRITAQNTGASATTTLSIDTVSGTLQTQTQAGNLPVSLSEVASGVTVPTQVTDRSASISIAANATTSGSVTGINGAATATIQLTGTFSATVQVQVTADGTNWLNVTGSNSLINVQTGAYIASGNLTAVGLYQLDVAGVSGVRVITTAWASGTVTGTVRVTNTPAAVSIEGVPAVTVSSGTITTVSTVTTCSTVTTVGSVTAANLNIPGIIQDVASAAFTTVGTLATSTLTPTFGTSYVVAIPVTAVTGTTPTYDVVVQESDDSGTNWYDVYHFPRITATGIYRSPKLPLSGNRVRYNQTGGGTSPSFTRSIQRLQASDSVSVYRQLIDRAISLTTLNAATAALNVQGCSGVQLVINLGAATTAPTLTLEGSDDNGATWYAIGTLLGVASSTVQITVPGISPQQVRARVSVVGATVTAGYVLVRGY